MTFTVHGDPWELIDRWLAEAEGLDHVASVGIQHGFDMGTKDTLRRCADDLIEIAGPRAFATQEPQ